MGAGELQQDIGGERTGVIFNCNTAGSACMGYITIRVCVQVVEEVDSFFTSSLKHIRTAGPNRGHNKGFVIGRLNCAETKPALAA